MRLNKYIAHCGLCSRRKAEVLIFERHIRVNGEIVENPATEIGPQDRVMYKDKILEPITQTKVYMLHKPIGYTSSMKDIHNDKLVADLIDCEERVYPVGRLDKGSSGLILMTNDGTLAHRLTHPRYGHQKTYEVLVRGLPSREKIAALEEGPVFPEGKLSPCRIRLIGTDKNTSRYKVILQEGRNRQIRRMFAMIGHPVLELKRLAIGTLTLGQLQSGHYRLLEKNEIRRLEEKPCML